MNRKKSNQTATIAMFFATMLVINVLSTIVFSALPLPIRPTLVHVPVIIASILYGPRIGMTLGTLMGIMSVIHNTIIQTPTNYLFSPLVENGNFYSLIIAVVPRILIGITPYFVYKIFKNRAGLPIAGAIGSMTNTVFVLGGIFILFSDVYNGNIQAMLATVLGTNAIAEMIISAFLTTIIVPRLASLKK